MSVLDESQTLSDYDAPLYAAALKHSHDALVHILVCMWLCVDIRATVRSQTQLRLRDNCHLLSRSFSFKQPNAFVYVE